MSTVIEHLADLRKIANRYGNEMHGLRQNDRDFQFQAILFCGVHLDELEALTSGNAIGRLRDALRMTLDIAQRRSLLPAEVAHIEALLAESPADPLKSLTELSEELGLHSVQPPASALPLAVGVETSWQPITKPGQVQVGTRLRFKVGDEEFSEVAKLILDAGTAKEEIVYNKRRNFYLITSMAIAGTGCQKSVEFLGPQVGAPPPLSPPDTGNVGARDVEAVFELEALAAYLASGGSGQWTRLDPREWEKWRGVVKAVHAVTKDRKSSS